MIVAVSALAGCVTVQYPPAPGPPAAPSEPSVPRPDKKAEPQVVQAPAQEALERVGPDRRPESTAPPQRPAPAAPAEPPPPRSHPRAHPHPHPRPAHPEPRRHAPPRVEVPDVQKDARGNGNVCALGKKYGGWRSDSPEAVICEGTYGR